MDRSTSPQLTPALTLVFATATGALVANLYYAQPLIALIAPDLRITPAIAGLLTAVTQFGYGFGLLFLVSLADLIENKRLILINIAIAVVSLIAAATAHSATVFLAAAFVSGICCTGGQILLPLAAHMVPQEQRGRVIGSVMSGLLTGIMLARPLSSFIAAQFGWRAVFYVSAGLMICVGLLLARLMPRHQPRPGLHYGQILLSMLRLVKTERVLQRRALYQGLMFCGFNMFWTAAPLMLARDFGFDQNRIALFALAGAGGALSAPLAGRLADKGYAGRLTVSAALLLAASFLASRWSVPAHAILLTAIFAVSLDAAVQVNQIASQRMVYAISAEARGRVNAGYMSIVFAIGAGGSTLGAALFERGGWNLTSLVGTGIGLVMLALFATEKARA